MSLLSELVAQLQALIERSREAQGDITTAYEKIEATLGQIQAATDGSTNPLPEHGIGQLRSGLEKLQEAQALTAAAAERWEGYIAVLRGGGASSSGGGSRAQATLMSTAPPLPGLEPIKGPAATTPPTHVGKRHLFDQIRLNSPAKEKNTVVLTHIDTNADVALIKSGRARHVRDNLYEVNERTYGIETPSGTVYPVRGNGFVEMDKLQFTAFKGLLAYDGDRAAAERDPKIARFRRHMTEATWEHAREVFEQGRRRA